MLEANKRISCETDLCSLTIRFEAKKKFKRNGRTLVVCGGTQHTQPVLQGCQAEIPAKKLKRGHRKKNFWPNFG